MFIHDGNHGSARFYRSAETLLIKIIVNLLNEARRIGESLSLAGVECTLK